MNQNYIIGLDLGINNVGYAVVDENTKTIEKKGVRLYKASDKAEDRRVARNTRRRMKRKTNRIQDSLSLFKHIGFPKENTIDEKLLQKRIKGLKEKLEPQDIVNVVCYFMRHRGYIPFGDEERELIQLNGMFPCEYYNKLHQDLGKHRALEQVVNHIDLIHELKNILLTQTMYYPEIGDIIGDYEKQNGLLWIFSRKRKFWEGPGSEKSFSPFGRFVNQDDVLEYQQMKLEGKEKFLFEDLIGHCKIYREEKCAPKANFFAEKFNLLNDFINIRITNIENIKKVEYISITKDKTYKLTTEALEELVNYCINYNEKTLTYAKVLKEVLGLTKNDITGYRVKKDGSIEFNLMKTYQYVVREFKKNDLDSTWLLENSWENYNKLMNILAVAPGIVEITHMLAGSIRVCSEKEQSVIKTIHDKLKKDGMLQYHALSEKALVKAIHDMQSTCLNFMQVSKKFDYEKESREYFVKNYGSGKGRLLMSSKYVDEIIASPQVRKTLRQAIRVINAIIKEKGNYPSVIAIESTKDMNSDEKRKEIEKEQSINEKNRKDAKALLEGVTTPDKVTENMIQRVMFYQEINGVCPYCGKPININDVLNNTVEVEHILPISQSGDDSQNNKTLSCRSCNANKKNRTPFMFLNEKEFDDFTKRINALKISARKRNNFLTQEDLNKYQIRFFNRNLRDTSYATKELVNQVHLFNEYLKANTKDIEILTLSTPGQLTHSIRENLEIKKDRDDGVYHHAVDASIIAGIATTTIGKKIVEAQNDPQYWVTKKEEAKEIPKLLEDFYFIDMKDEIMKIQSDEDILISMQVNKDANRSISNANIYSYIKKGEDFYKIEQISDIYSIDLIRQKKDLLDTLFDENNSKSVLLCQEQNPKLFQYLQKIYFNFAKEKENPFLNYCMEQLSEKENFDYLKHGIKTPSKNGNGVLIKKLRYMSSVSEPFLLEKKNIKKKDNTLIGLDSVSIYCTRLFWDKDLKKIIFIPVYVPTVDFKTKRINENHPLYQNYFQKMLNGKNVEFIVDLFNGDYVEIEKSDGTILKEYIKGYDKSSKAIQCKSGKRITSKDRFTLYDVDVLGNKKKRLTWPKD